MSSERAEWKYAAAGFFGAWLLRFMRFTWRIRGAKLRSILDRRAARKGEPGTIYVLWHSRILLASAVYDGCGVNVLVSRHGDGEFIVRAIERLGFGTVRGSTTRGGARALLELLRTLRDGRDVAITPDGPKGPRMQVQQGCVVAASKARAPIVLLGLECSRVKRLRSWDRFIVPAPFARVASLQSEPIIVPEGLDEAGVNEWRDRIQAAYLALSRQAAEMVGADAETPDVDPLATRGATAV
jgi:lysophospholipid acyltransferase (LPLAT)-like uncharacterized protein